MGSYTVCVVHVEANKHIFSHSLPVESSTAWGSLTLTSEQLSRSESMAKSGRFWIALTSSQHLQWNPAIWLSQTYWHNHWQNTDINDQTRIPGSRGLRQSLSHSSAPAFGTERRLTPLRGPWERPRWRDRHFLLQREKWRTCPPLTLQTPNKPRQPLTRPAADMFPELRGSALCPCSPPSSSSSSASKAHWHFKVKALTCQVWVTVADAWPKACSA